MIRIRILMATALTMGLVATGALAQQVTGAGATFPAPLYQKWGEGAEAATQLQMNYQAIGSGGGMNQIVNRTVDFGASDANLTAEKLAEANLLQFPTVMGAIVLAYNLPGVAPGALRLSGEVVADIYLGRITRWNDPRIVEMNPGLTLPNIAVAPIYRADGSGTTFQFAGYLSRVSETFRTDVGQGTSVAWKAGVGGRGNAGIAGLVRQTRGALGYVEYAYAKQSNLAVAQMRNHDGQFVQATIASFQAAAAGADWSSDPTFGISLLNQPGAEAWPIVAPTYILLPRNPTSVETSRNVMRLFDWAYRQGGPMAVELDYIPLPDNVVALVRAAWTAQVRGPGGETVWPAQ